VVLGLFHENPYLEKCYKLGANRYVAQPVVFAEFVNEITQVGSYWLQRNIPQKK